MKQRLEGPKPLCFAQNSNGDSEACARKFLRGPAAAESLLMGLWYIWTRPNPLSSSARCLSAHLSKDNCLDGGKWRKNSLVKLIEVVEHLLANCR